MALRALSAVEAGVMFYDVLCRIAYFLEHLLHAYAAVCISLPAYIN